MPRKCAFGCDTSDSTGITHHVFPNPDKLPERFQVWVNSVGGKLERPADYEFFRKQRVCDRHFKAEHRNQLNRLNILAVPYPIGHIAVVTADVTTNVTPDVTPDVAPDVSIQDVAAEINPVPSTSFETAVTAVSIVSSRTTTQVKAIPATYRMSPRVRHSVTQEHNYFKIRQPHGRKNIIRPVCTTINRLRSEISRLRKRGQSFKDRLRNAEDLSESKLLQTVTKTMNKPAKIFMQMQLQTTKKPKGRRFTTEEKVLALSLYKRSPKCYSILYKLFTLPSAKAMKRLLSSVKLCAGINPIIFEKIKNTILKKPVTDRLCSLIFDKMSLTPHVNYNAETDTFEGFATTDNTRFADHALVFMVKGIKQNFKQPIAYYFVTCLNKLELKNIIKTVVERAQAAGLIIINTVCDQSTVNVGAITELVNETRAKYLRLNKEWRHDLICLNGQNIIPIYDAPHLIKGIRNNLITKDMSYKVNEEEKIVKWEYYQNVYAADKSYGELRLLHKLTEEHVNPDKINKMRVKSATQIFSRTVAGVTEHLAGRGDISADCRQLIYITLLLDNLFDSLNGNTFYVPNGKQHKGPIKRNSSHHDLWRNAKIILKTIKFGQVKTVNNKTRLVESSIPSVTNMIKTIEGMEAIWKVLSQKCGLDAVLTRNFNQDPVDNFFGNIRIYGARNIAPNSIAFEGAFKALLLNNYNSPHSNKANCEEDSNDCLQTSEFFLTEKSDVVPSDVPNDNIINCNDDLFTFNNDKETDAGQRNYVCGWVLTKCLKNIVKSCENCRQNIIDKSDTNKQNAYIRAKEYSNKTWLCYPREKLENCFHEIQNITVSFLKRNVPKRNIKKNIVLIADALVDYPFNCTLHQKRLREYFNNITVNIIIYSWCRSINRILSGKLTYDGDDENKTAAQLYYNKHKHYKNKK